MGGSGSGRKPASLSPEERRARLEEVRARRAAAVKAKQEEREALARAILEGRERAEAARRAQKALSNPAALIEDILKN